MKGRTIPTPEEHDRNYLEVLRKIIAKGAKFKNVRCPKCGNEMIYDDNIILSSMPPRRHIHCPKCRYSTTIFC